jgi:hypothetical protein
MTSFNTWFQDLITSKNKVDPEIAQSFAAQQDFYAYAAGVAKGYFGTNNEPFVPQEPTSGTYGVRELLPQDIGVIDWVTNVGRSTVHTWVQTITLAANVNWANLFGTPAVPVTPSNTQSYHGLLAFHSLIAWNPGTRITALKHTVNSYTYPEVSVEQAAKIEKPFKTFKIIPLEGNFLIQPTGQFNTRLNMEKVVFANAESYVENIAILGLVFAEYQYLNIEVS